MGFWLKFFNGDFSAAPFEKICSDFFGKYSSFVIRHPLPFIFSPILITLLLSTGIIFQFQVVRGVHYLYSPLNAQWKTEQEVFQKYWVNNDENFYPGKDAMLRKGFYIIATAHDDGDILRPKLAKELRAFIDWFTNTTFTASDNRNYSFRDVCLKFQNDCFSNDQIRFLAEIFAKGDQVFFNLTYPLFTSNFMSESMDLSNVLGGVKLRTNGIIGSAKAWMIGFQFRQHPININQIRYDFWLFLSEQIKQKKTPTPNLNIYYYHSETFDLELAQNLEILAPRFVVTFVILIVFALFCTFNFVWIPTNSKLITQYPVIDWISSKPLLGLAGVLATLLAIISAIGLLLLIGITFVDMCSVMPFLSLTIGIDDTFLMLAAWHETNRKLLLEDRMEQAMRHAAVSITITSLTDSLAFLIGAIAPLPAVTYFCLYSSMAIFFIYIYFMTIFVAILSILGCWEAENRNALFYLKTMEWENSANMSTVYSFFNIGKNFEVEKESNRIDFKKSKNFTMEKEYLNEFWYQRFFQKIYVRFICQPIVQWTALTTYLIYALLAFVGINNLIVGFDLINIVAYDSPARQFLKIRSEYFPEDIIRLDLATLNPPNMGNFTERNEFLKVLSQLENSYCSMGPKLTGFWFYEWQKYLDNLGFDDLSENVTEFNNNLMSFLMTKEKLKHDIIYSRNNHLDAFRLTINLQNFKDDETILKCSKVIRQICGKYDKFKLFSYSPLWNLADQYEIIWPQTMQDLYISVAVMTIISLLAIPQPLCAFAIALNIMSIGLGVIGFMSWWSVNLDATSMITIAMSVGFSVDFAAHVTYAYTKNSDKLEPEQCLGRTLSSVGWPITQASVSVILGISTLATVPTYIVQTCFKTVLLVILFGMIHALLYLPLLLMNTHKLFRFLYVKMKLEF